MKFSGYGRLATVSQKREKLLQAVEEAGHAVRDTVELARYKLLWIPGFLRIFSVETRLESIWSPKIDAAEVLRVRRVRHKCADLMLRHRRGAEFSL